MSAAEADVAGEILRALRACRQVQPFSARRAGYGVAEAYRDAAALRRLRAAAGEKPVGRKIGFTNRGIWNEYEVYGPIWGDMYDRTVRIVDEGDDAAAMHLPEPRIEPEIVIGLADGIDASMDEADIAARIAWVAHGFEIVQSIFPGWRFQAADCIAGGGLHGALYHGPKRAVASSESAGLARSLAGLSLMLFRNGEEVDRGVGANALDGPVAALRHLAQVLDGDSHNPPLQAGEIVTTGTLTRAFPVRSGEVWSTQIVGFDLPGLSVRIV